jgi:hypothetical protein
MYATLLSILLTAFTQAAMPEVSDAWQPILLPGQSEFVFTMYSCPGDLEGLQELVEVMQREQLGNGFDPGPAAHANSADTLAYLGTLGWPVVSYPGYPDFQIEDGVSILTDEDEAALQGFEEQGSFHAIQLGEWGYYFHNLSMNRGYWRGRYGDKFNDHKHRLKPQGLAGYDSMPSGKRAAYERLRSYFLTRQRAMRGRNLSVTGHSHYEAYAAEWGARIIGLEVGENIAFAQSKFAFARGASRQWDTPWAVQVSPWMHGACTTAGPLTGKGGSARGLDAGHSLSFYTRMWLHGWFAGAAMVTPENSIAIFFEPGEPKWRLTSHAQRAKEVFAFMRKHDRGTPYTPVAIVLDHLSGYNGYMAKPWGILEPTPGDLEVEDLFEEQLFPGTDLFHAPPVEPGNPEAGYLRPTPYGENFDVLLNTATESVLSKYPAILLAGDIDFDGRFVTALFAAVRSGTTLLLQPRHVNALGEDFAHLQGTGAVEVLDVWENPTTRRPAVIAHDRLAALVNELSPIAVEGDPVQYQINRNRNGWVVELVNNEGVVKQNDHPAVVDPDRIVTVHLKPRFAFQTARRWTLAGSETLGEELAITIPPGEAVFVEFALGQ